MALRTTAAALVFCSFLAAQAVTAPRLLTLQQAAERKGADYVPAREGQDVEVQGVVSHEPIRILHYTHVPIQDKAMYGLVLESPGTELDGLRPGDVVRVRGLMGNRGGLPVLRPTQARVVGRQTPPEPLPLKIAEVSKFRYMGVLIEVETTVGGTYDNMGGEVMMVGDALKVFLPRGNRLDGPVLRGYERGDRVKVRGIASQYAGFPPYNRNFQISVGNPDEISIVSRQSFISPATIGSALLSVATASGVWMLWVRRVNRLRQKVKQLNSLGEEVIGDRSPGELLEKLTNTLPGILNVTGVRLYLFDRAMQKLEKVPTAEDPAALTISVENAGEPDHGAAVCCRNRAAVEVPDTRKAGIPVQPDTPRSLVFIPMFAHRDLFGVLELRNDTRVRSLGMDEMTAVQHFANQLGAALKLLHQQGVQEQLFRSEKLAAAGLLISTVSAELRTPIESIALIAERLAGHGLERPAADDAAAIAAEAKRANDIMSRLSAFAWQRAETHPVDLNRIVEGVLAQCQEAWRENGIEGRVTLSMEPIPVIVAEVQFEQVFLNLLNRAEAGMRGSSRKWISVMTRLLPRRALLEVSSPGSMDTVFNLGEGLSVEVSRSVIQSQGGEFRRMATPDGGSKFEIELPIPKMQGTSQERFSEQTPDRALNVLMVEPDAAEQRQLMMLLSDRCNRVVPVMSGDEAIDIAQRMRFDIIFTTVRLSGMNWLGLFERVRPLVPAFVLMTEGFVPPLAMNLCHILQKPVKADDLDRLLATILPRLHEVNGKEHKVAQAGNESA